MTSLATAGNDQISIRRAAPADLGDLARLSSLDTRPIPAGAVLVAERGDRVVAALSLDTGETVADPFEPTAGLVELLERRAAQLAQTTQKVTAANWRPAAAITRMWKTS